MSVEQFADSLRYFIERSPGLGRLLSRDGSGNDAAPLACDLIANPKAGGFTRRLIYRRHMAELAALNRDLPRAPLREIALRVWNTERPGHAFGIVEGIGEALAREGDPASPRRLLMTAGGDGTSLESMSALYGMAAPGAESFAVLRLPMGTGNDGSDGRELPDSVLRLGEGGRLAPMGPLVVRPNPAGGKGPFLAFNIASVGADAFITHMTNKLKTSFPGDSYKLWVDLASVAYDKLYKVAPMRVGARGPSGEALPPLEGSFLLLAMGVTGNRTYGSNKLILPDGDNVCAIGQMPFLRKLAVKGRIESGLHRGLPEAHFLSASAITIEYAERILVQMDGEAVELGAADFPLEMSLGEKRLLAFARA